MRDASEAINRAQRAINTKPYSSVSKPNRKAYSDMLKFLAVSGADAPTIDVHARRLRAFLKGLGKTDARKASMDKVASAISGLDRYATATEEKAATGTLLKDFYKHVLGRDDEFSDLFTGINVAFVEDSRKKRRRNAAPSIIRAEMLTKQQPKSQSQPESTKKDDGAPKESQAKSTFREALNNMAQSWSQKRSQKQPSKTMFRFYEMLHNYDDIPLAKQGVLDAVYEMVPELKDGLRGKVSERAVETANNLIDFLGDKRTAVRMLHEVEEALSSDSSSETVMRNIFLLVNDLNFQRYPDYGMQQYREACLRSANAMICLHGNRQSFEEFFMWTINTKIPNPPLFVSKYLHETDGFAGAYAPQSKQIVIDSDFEGLTAILVHELAHATQWGGKVFINNSTSTAMMVVESGAIFDETIYALTCINKENLKNTDLIISKQKERYESIRKVGRNYQLTPKMPVALEWLWETLKDQPKPNTIAPLPFEALEKMASEGKFAEHRVGTVFSLIVLACNDFDTAQTMKDLTLMDQQPYQFISRLMATIKNDKDKRIERNVAYISGRLLS